MSAAHPRPHVDHLVDSLGFPLDRFQREAADAISEDRSVLVAAPTGAGKTVVAEYAVADALDRGLRAFYTTPIKALSNQKFGELRARYGSGRVGLLTGDNSVDGDAPVVVMTTEVLRNMIYAGRPLDDLGVVVLDEVHYLQNSFRGPVWEEVIIHLPEHVQLVCLSATVSNAVDIGDWLSTVRGPTDVVVEHQRPVELTNTYLVGDKSGGGRLRLVETLLDGRPNPEGHRFDVDRDSGSGRNRRQRGGGSRRRWFTPDRLEVLEVLDQRDLLPAIVFVFSRAGCDDAVRTCLDAGVRLTSRQERQQIRAIADRHLEALSDADFRALGGERWMAGLEAGLAAHHAGHVPPFKEAVEACFAAGLVRLVFATETLALGINMPARSVVIERMTKFNGESREFLTPAEYTQLTGRAGRRGIDSHGTAVVLWSPFVSFAQIAGLAGSRTFVLRSAFRPTYNMAVNLIRRHDREGARRLLNQSLAQYQADRAVVVSERRLAKRRAALDDLLDEARCERGDVEQYRDLLQVDLPRRERRRRLESLLGSLSPGDVIALDDQPRVVVLSVAHRSGERIKVDVIAPGGDAFTIGMPDFDMPPEVLAKVQVPQPFQPRDDAFRTEVARRLELVDVPRPSQRGSAIDHPVGDCPDADEHIRALDRAERVRREVTELAQRIDRQAGTLGVQFEHVLEVLDRLGYVEGWSVTPRGDLLAGVYHESDLVVAESIATGCFDGLDAPELAAVASSLVYEHRAPGPPPAPHYPSDRVEDRCRQIDGVVRTIAAHEEAVGLPPSRGGQHNFARLAHEWCAGEPLSALLEHGDVELTGGDFVRTVRQLVDLVRQIGQLAPDATTRTTARRAVGALERGVVAATVDVDAGDHESPDGAGA